MKRTIIFRLIVLLVALMAGGAVASAYDFEEGGIFYTVNSNGTTLTVARNTESPYSGDVVIPNFVSHDGTTYTVTAIGEYAFMYCTDLTSIVISDSVNTVGIAAFRSCTGLRNVTIGKSITTLRYKKGSVIFYAFQNCDSITSLTWNAVNCADNGYMGTANIEQVIIGEEVEVITNGLAEGSQIEEITIPNSVNTIGNSAFAGCTGLTGELTIPNSVTTIGNAAFAGCTGLTGELIIPNSVIAIGGSAFAGCTGLTGALTIPNSVTAIGGSAFAACTGLEELVIPNSLTTIGVSTFAGCTGLNGTLTIPNSVTTIGEGAFSGCIGIEEITIPNSVTQIYAGAFNGCDNLSKVNISSLEAWCGIVFGMGMMGDYSRESSNPIYYAHHLYLNGQEVTDLVIPESITAINSYAFYGGSGFTSITLGNAVTTICNYAFSGCTGLTNLTIGDAVTTIGESAFEGCTGLTSLTISKSVISISGNIIVNCPSLTSLSVESGNPIFDSRDNCNAIIETATNTLVVGSQTTVIPNTVTAIGASAFTSCDGLTSIVIPNSVTSIGVETYVNEYQNDTTFYYYNPFMFCTNLRTIIVESGNPVFDSRDNCNGIIETATNTLKFGCNATIIPNTVTAIGDNAFCGSGLKSFDIPNSVTTIGEAAFSGCSALTNIDIPNSVTSIGDYAFGACLSLKEITIPNSVIVSQSYAATGWFQHCWSLERVTIGSGIARMGVMFNDCPKITSVTCLRTAPPGYDSYYNSQTHESVYNFDNAVYTQATLYVPVGSLEEYQSKREWSFFQDIRPLGDADGDGIVGVADVTRIIDYIQSGSGNGFDIGAADTDGDGNVTIGDVTKLIDAILNQRSV